MIGTNFYIKKVDIDRYILTEDLTKIGSGYAVSRGGLQSKYDFTEVEQYYIQNPDKRFEYYIGEKEIENYRQQLVVYNNTYQQLQININQINNWFTVYDQQIQQYNRSIRLNIPYDAKYGTIEALDAQAVINAKRLNELRQELEELEKTKPQEPKL